MTSKASGNRANKRVVKRATNQDSKVHEHLPAMREIHPELREMVNNFLQSKNIPLKVHAIHFTTDMDSADVNCCVINGMVVCGPQCG